MCYLARRLPSALPPLFAALLLVAAAAGFGTAQAAMPATTAATDAVSAPGTPQTARWTKKKIYFTYMGFTTHYSCQGLTDKVRRILLDLGARKSDLNVHEAGCTSLVGRPEPFPAVAGTFSVLEPVSPEQAYSPNAAPGAVAAHWQPVNVRFDFPGLDMDGQCELLEQVKSRILPLIPARNVQYKSTCVPYQLIPGGTSLKVEVLVPDSASAGPARNQGDLARERSELASSE
jgi:hypothetical protein